MAEMCKNHLSLESEEIDDEDDSLSLHSEEGVSNRLDVNTNFQGRSQGGLEQSRKRMRKWLYCHHCNQEVSKSTYYRHKKSRVYEEDKELGADYDFHDGALHERYNAKSITDCDEAFSIELESSRELEVGTPNDDWHIEENAWDKMDEDELQFFDFSSSDEDDEMQERTDLEEILDEQIDEVEPERTTTPWQLRSILVYILMWQFCFGISDAGVLALLLFLYSFLKLVTTGGLFDNFPRTLKAAFRMTGIDVNAFIQYIVCPACNSVFNYDFGCTVQDGNKVSNSCPHIALPNHPHISQRQPCGELLMKSVKGRSGTSILRPYKVFPYQSVKEAIKNLISRNGFMENCEHWKARQHTIPSGMLGDVYEGKVWREFHEEFFQQSQAHYNLCLTINVDWFQPFTHTRYSVGAIYLVVQNLPRQIRYKMENIILVGVIPGPKEPKLTMNSYLYPLVQEMKELWEGVIIPCTATPVKRVLVCTAITCCASDIPATRKLCGFVGHSAKLGCSKCSKEFITLSSSENKRDYSGYNQELWSERSLSEHQQQASNYLKAKTKADQKSIEDDFGLRYTVLLELPYFDPIRFSVVDPMHNIYLGSAKHAMQVWVDKGILTKKHFHEIEKIVSKFKIPQDVGRLPLKISSGFSGFTADQWRSWVTIFSPVALKGILPSNHLRCWLLYVRACTLLCTRIITRNAIKQADQYLVLFCQQFVSLYGAEACTPNMHLHLHLKDCLLDYGPVHGFWCFGFERFNGIMGRYHTNSQSIETQLMRKFLREQHIRAFDDIPSEAQSLFNSLNISSSGSLLETSCEHDNERILKLRTLADCNSLQSDYSIDNDLVHLLPPLFKGVLATSEVQKLQAVYTCLYPNVNIHHFSRFYLSSTKCSMAGELFSMASMIAAFWPVESMTTAIDRKLQVGQITGFIKHTIVISEGDCHVKKNHIFCQVQWYIKHHQTGYFGTSAIVCTPITYAANSASYMPIQRISHRCSYAKLPVTIPPRHISEELLVAVPINSNFSL